MAKKKELGKERFDVRAIYKNVGINEKEYAAVPAIEKKKGKNSNYVRTSFALHLTDLLEICLLTKSAEEMEIPQGSLSDYRSGKVEPRISALSKIAGHFSVSADYLLGLTDVKTIEADKKKACEYTGLSDEAIEKLSKGKNDEEWPLYSAIMSYLIESDTLNKIVAILENSLVVREQYGMLFDMDNAQTQRTLETLEYQFNKQLTNLYTAAINDLHQKISDQISNIATSRYYDWIDSARETRDKMQEIIDMAERQEIVEKYGEIVAQDLDAAYIYQRLNEES